MSARHPELDRFVREALLRGLPRADVEQALLRAGWSRDQARGALDAFADLPFPIPVPRARPSRFASEAFRYLLMFGTLYLSAYHLGALAFLFIDRTFPDPVDRINTVEAMNAMRWSAASLMIAFPVFLLTAQSIRASQVCEPVQRLSPIRHWLTYLTLLVAAGILIGDLTTLLYNVLGGELSVRFALKVLAVGVISGTIFGYYLADIRRAEPL